METLGYTAIALLGDIVNLVLTLLAISVPVVCAFKGYGFFKTNLIAIPIIFALVILGAYLGDIYPLFQLKLMGFDIQGMSDAERLLNVPLSLRETATELYSSIFGIGWPLKAIFAMVFVSPYPSAVWVMWLLMKSSLKRTYR